MTPPVRSSPSVERQVCKMFRVPEALIGDDGRDKPMTRLGCSAWPISKSASTLPAGPNILSGASGY